MELDEIRKNLHQTHIESLVFSGPDGLGEINDYITDNLDQETSSTNKTTKIDGSPSLLIGHNVPGYPKEFVGIKSVLNSPKNAYSTEEQIKANKPDIADKMIYGLKLAKYIPSGEIWQGDCLFNKSEVKEQNINGKDYLVFKPNTIVYAFPETNPDYEKLKNADFGICFHTIYRPSDEGFSQSFKVDLSRVNIPDNYFLLSPTLKADKEKIDTKKLKELFVKLKEAELKLLNDSYYEDICNNKAFRTYWDTFENHITSDQKLTHINKETFIKDLTDWVNEKIPSDFSKRYKDQDKAASKAQVALSELQYMIEQRKQTLSNMIDCFNLVVDVKDILISWYSGNPGYDTYLQSRTKGYIPSGGEGIALSDDNGNIVKLVNRAEFSNANRDPDIIKGFEHESLQESADTIKLITVQGKDVLDKLKKGETYYSDFSNAVYKNYKQQYENLSKLLGLDHLPIFCSPASDETAIDASGDIRNNRVKLELEVPKDEAHLTDYYSWSDYLYYSDGNEYDDYFKFDAKQALDNIDKYVLVGEADTPQYVIDKIKPEWVKNINESYDPNNMVNTVSNTDKDPSVIATKQYHKMKTKKLKPGQMIVSAVGEELNESAQFRLTNKLLSEWICRVLGYGLIKKEWNGEEHNWILGKDGSPIYICGRYFMGNDGRIDFYYSQATEEGPTIRPVSKGKYNEGSTLLILDLSEEWANKEECFKELNQKYKDKLIKKYNDRLNYYNKYLKDHSLDEKIVKKGSKWQVQSEKGRNMGTYDTKAEAEKRLQQVHYFKYKNEDYEVGSPEAKKLNSIIYRCIKSLNDLKDQIEPTWGKYDIMSRSLLHNGKHDVGVKGDKEFALKVQKFIRGELERNDIHTRITIEDHPESSLYNYNIIVWFPNEKDKDRLLDLQALDDLEEDFSSFGNLDD